MPVIPINYPAILACGVAAMVLGSLWYGPLFGKQWMTLIGMTPDKIEAAKKEKGKMMKSYGLMFVGSLIMAYVLAHALVFASAYLKASGTSAGLTAGFWNWLGFIAPVMLGKVLWEGKPWKLWALDSGYYLVLLCLDGVILANWR
jgi:hypothetical protein